MPRRFFKYMALALIVILTFSNCSGDDSFEFSPDPTCGRNINFIVEVIPDGAGIVNRSEYVNSFGLNGLMPFQVIEYFAIPADGYQFIKWDLAPIADREENPISLIPCDINPVYTTVRIKAIFELREE